MLPLASLEEKGNLYGDYISKKLKQILDRGDGLPLLFPSFELGFTYGDDNDPVSDTALYNTPDLKLGRRFPHCELEIICNNIKASDLNKHYPHLTISNGNQVSLTDISAQLQNANGAPTFVLIVSAECSAKLKIWRSFFETLPSEDWVLQLITVHGDHQMWEDSGAYENECLSLLDSKNEWKSLMSDNAALSAVLMRPDAHIAGILQRNGDEYNVNVLREWIDTAFDSSLQKTK